MYLRGIGVLQSDEMALKYFEMAANKNLSKAQGALANFYLEGLGVKKSMKKAFQLFEKAAE